MTRATTDQGDDPTSRIAAPHNLRALFDQIMECAPGDRDRWLADHVPDLSDRHALARLIAAADAGGPLDTPPAERAARIDRLQESPVDGLIGQRIGAFRLTRLLGQGGMAAVFLGERDDADFRQVVAVKLLRRGLYSDIEQRLFRRERQALAALSHPNIAHLVDGGVTDAGIPYLVIEYIDGVAITQHAVERQLGLRARLKLFAVVCRAVAAAHASLIVHRDIKPSNILVTPGGNVKLLDFGIAKLLDDSDEHPTRTGMSALTPGYAAPEQYAGGPISTATDVYALGVLMHELLLGERPAADPMQRPSSRVEQLATDLWALPSSRPVLRAALKGDLDNILLKSLSPEPERRYVSAGHLADDIDRYLDAQPVSAHPPSTWYRTRKFVQRHRGGVALTMAFAIGLIASLGIAVWQANLARDQARIAREQTRHAEEVSNFLVGLFDAQIPSRPDEETPDTAELLRRGVDRAMTTLGDSPALQSSLLVALGRVYDHLAYGDRALPMLDTAVTAAQRVPDDPALLGQAISERGELDLSMDRYTEAITRFDQAIDLQTRAAPGGLALALTLDRRALAHSKNGDHERAIADYRAAMTIREQLLPADHPERINSRHSIGTALERAGRNAEAEPHLRAALDQAVAAYGDAHVKTANFLKSYATNRGLAGDTVGAIPFLERVVAAERALYPADHPDRGQGLNNLAFVYLRAGRLHDALRTLEEAIDLNQRGGFADGMGQTFLLGNRGRVREIMDDTDGALADIDASHRIAKRIVGPDHARVLALKLTQLRLRTQLDAAHAPELLAFSRQLLVDPSILGQFQARSALEARFGEAQAMLASGRQQEGLDALRQMIVSDADPADPFVLRGVADLARIEHADGRSAPARTLITERLALIATSLPATHYSLGELHLVRAQIDAVIAPDTLAADLDAARTALAELPASHPWRMQLDALTRTDDATQSR